MVSLCSSNFVSGIIKSFNEVFKSQSEITVYEKGEDHLKKSSVNAKYCFIVIELESLLFMF